MFEYRLTRQLNLNTSPEFAMIGCKAKGKLKVHDSTIICVLDVQSHGGISRCLRLKQLVGHIECNSFISKHILVGTKQAFANAVVGTKYFYRSCQRKWKNEA